MLSLKASEAVVSLKPSDAVLSLKPSDAVLSLKARPGLVSLKKGKWILSCVVYGKDLAKTQVLLCLFLFRIIFLKE